MSPSKPSLRSSPTAAALATPPPMTTIRDLLCVLLTGADVHVDHAVLADPAGEPRQLRVVRVDAEAGGRADLPQVLGAGQGVTVQVALVERRGLVRASVGVGQYGAVQVDQEHVLAVDRDGGHVAFPQVIEVDGVPPAVGHGYPAWAAAASSRPARCCSRAARACEATSAAGTPASVSRIWPRPRAASSARADQRPIHLASTAWFSGRCAMATSARARLHRARRLESSARNALSSQVSSSPWLRAAWPSWVSSTSSRVGARTRFSAVNASAQS